MRLVTRFAPVLLVVTACFALGAAPPSAVPAPKPIVTVVRHGGLCRPGTECRSLLRITDTTISGSEYKPRRLLPSERRALLRAVRALDPAYLAAHPFRGNCPVAVDGQESIYRFRGFSRPLASCKYDLRGVRAVQLVERLLATLKPR
jgi:hypothetical protein